jgi:hypothetical protein
MTPHKGKSGLPYKGPLDPEQTPSPKPFAISSKEYLLSKFFFLSEGNLALKGQVFSKH